MISNGEEKGKGNDLVKETYPLLQESGLNFVGNIESKEFYGGEVDLAVTDGFTGNVLIKTSEAVAKLLTEKLREHLMSSLFTKIGGVLAKSAFSKLKKDLDPGEIGAVPLLGLDGLVFVGHGRSDEIAMFNSIVKARQAVEANLLEEIRETITAELS